MPAVSVRNKLAVFLPNKAGGNNAILGAFRKLNIGDLECSKNGCSQEAVDPFIDYTRLMLHCDPASRFISMWRFMSTGKMSRTSDYVGLSFYDWAIAWKKQRILNSQPNWRNSWWMTLTECYETVKPVYSLPAEDMELTLEYINKYLSVKILPEHCGIHYDALRHRRGWENEWTRDVFCVLQAELEADAKSFNYPLPAY